MKQTIPEDLLIEFEEEINKIKTFDISKLELTSEDNAILNIFFKKFLDPAEDFPEGSRHNIIEKNFAIYIIKNKIPFEQIQEAYISKGYKSDSLLSQIKGVISGTYGQSPHVNIGELVNWCKKFRHDLIKIFNQEHLIELPEEPKFEKKENPFKHLHLSTDHLPYFHEFSNLVNLYGRQYLPLLKTRWYQLHGGILQKKIKLGNLLTDTRVHVCYPLPTEAGKNDFIYSIKQLIEQGIKKTNGELYTASEPISFHQEALIGKMIERLVDNPGGKPKQIKVRIENRGHLNNDFIDFDECNQLIKSSAPEMQQAREYLSKAENPIGRNKVEKRSVDDLPSETVSYYPVGTHSYYFQPFQKLPEGFVLQGFGRRKLIPVGDIKIFLTSANETIFENKLHGNDISEQDYKEILIAHLKNVANSSIDDYSFTDKAFQLIKDYALYISAQGDIHSEKISNFCKVSKWTSLSNLIKFSCILSSSYYKTKVDENCVSLAYMDLVELMQKTYDFIYDRVEGNFDYGTEWGGADNNQKEALKYLYEHEAFNRENSKISISSFIEVVAQIYKVKNVQARNRYLEMKNLGLINSAQIDQTNTRVWLKISPEEHKNYIEGAKGYVGYVAYNNIFLTKNSIITSLKSL